MPCAFWSEIMKCHIAATKGNLWVSPLQTQLSCWEKSRPRGDAACRFSSQQSSRTQPSSHCSLETRQRSEGASWWPKPRAYGSRVFGIFPTEALDTCGAESSCHLCVLFRILSIKSVTRMKWLLFYAIRFGIVCMYLIDKWTITLVKLASYLSQFP